MNSYSSCTFQGFNRQIDFFDDRIIKVNKTNKTTLPDTELILEDDKLKGNGRDGLLIRCAHMIFCSFPHM